MFTHLHVHSHFSFGQGASSPESLLKAAATRGYTALACTDTNGVYGAVEFQRAAEELGIRPILGAHLVHGGEECVALAEDEKGWAKLCRVISGIHWSLTDTRGEGEQISTVGSPSPRMRRGGQGVRLNTGEIRLSEALADRSGLSILSNDIEFLQRLTSTSGTTGLYAELRPGKERHAVLAAATRLGIPPVATGAVMFAHPEDWT